MSLPVNKILQGDCRKVMKDFPDCIFDAVITDPPYTLGDTDSEELEFKDRESFNKISSSEWDQDFEPTSFLPQAKRVMRDNGNIFIYTSHRRFGDYYEWLNEHYDRVFFGVWHKTNPSPQVRKSSFLSACELWIQAYNKGHKWNFLEQGEMHNIIEAPICMGEERYEHTAQKPVRAVEKLIKVSTDKDDLVLDPFAGTGTTCVAARNLGRKFIGIEINQRYCEISRKRLKMDSKKLDSFVDKEQSSMEDF